MVENFIEIVSIMKFVVENKFEKRNEGQMGASFHHEGKTT